MQMFCVHLVESAESGYKISVLQKRQYNKFAVTIHLLLAFNTHFVFIIARMLYQKGQSDGWSFTRKRYEYYEIF